MNTPTHRSLEILAAIGLGIGAVFGLAGTLVSEDSVRQLFWAIDGVALVVAAALLTLRFLRLGNDLSRTLVKGLGSSTPSRAH